MGALLALSRAIDRINETIGKAVSWLILVSVLVSATNAIVRKAFDMSSNSVSPSRVGTTLCDTNVKTHW